MLLAAAVGCMNQILCYDWLPCGGKMDPSCLHRTACFDSRQGGKKKKVYNFWTLSLMESQKMAEDSPIKENLQDSCGFNVLQHNWLSIPVLKIHESFLILNKVRWFCYINPTKLVQLRWLDISLVLYLGFYWPRLQLGP